MIGLIAQTTVPSPLGLMKTLGPDLTATASVPEDPVVYYGLIADGVHTHPVCPYNAVFLSFLQSSFIAKN